MYYGGNIKPTSELKSKKKKSGIEYGKKLGILSEVILNEFVKL